MTEQLDLNAVKTKVHRIILEDGLLDIMLGIHLVLSGIYLINRSVILNYLWLPFALALIEVIRRKYVYPRSGYVNIKLSAGEIIRILLAIIAVVALITIIIGLAATGLGLPLAGNWRELTSYAMIVFLPIFFYAIAYKFTVPRWYLNGISMGIAFFLAKVYDIPWLLIALGLFITLIGVVVFVRYFRKFTIKSDGSLRNHEQTSGEVPHAS